MAPRQAGDTLFYCIVLSAVTLAAYARVWGLGFVGVDDLEYVGANPHVLAGPTPSSIAWAFTTTALANWHPLTWISLMLDAAIGGSNPRIYHATNLLLHLANTLLLFLVFRRMTRSAAPSAFVAALFGIHPLHVESVAWIVERKDVLSTLFWILTIGAYVRYAAKPEIGRYLIVALTFALGLLTKPMLVSLPLVLFLLDYWPFGRWAKSDRSSLVFEKLPLFALAGLSCLVTLIAQKPAIKVAAAIPFAERAVNALISYVVYLERMLWPVGLAAYYPFPRDGHRIWQALLAAALLAAVSAAAVVLARKHPWLPVGWFWYLITLVPVIGVVQVGLQARADRYTYVPLIGIFIVVSWGAPTVLRAISKRTGVSRAEIEGGRIGRSAVSEKGESAARAAKVADPERPVTPPWTPALLGTLAVVSALALSAATWVQVGYWENGIALYAHALEVTKDNAVAHANLGVLLSEQGDVAQGIAHLREALQITPGMAEPHFNLTRLLISQGKVDEATGFCAYERNEWPSDERTLVNLGLLAMIQKRYDEAADRFTEAVRIYPDSVYAHLNLASIRAGQGREQEARAHFAELERIVGPEKARELGRSGSRPVDGGEAR